MNLLNRTKVIIAVASLALLASASAFANSLVFSGDPGDYISGGQTYNYQEYVTGAASSDNNSVSVNAILPNYDHWWYLNMAAPAGQKLVPGSYVGAVRYPFQEGGPGFDLSGDGRGCNTSQSTFTVTQAVYGAYGYLQDFEATYEQHCEGMEPALMGSVSIHNPPPPPAMVFSLELNPAGTVKRQTGVATVSGKVVCSAATTAQVSGIVSQRAGRFAIASGNFYINVPCSTTPTTWSANVTSYGTPFNAGQAQADVQGNAYDPAYGGFAHDAVSTVVNLKGK
jgi:hypothetical protein